MLFLAGADHERYEKVKWTRRYLLGHRRILKKGRRNYAPSIPLFQKGKRRLEISFSNRRHLKSQDRCRATVLCLGCYL